MNQVHPWQTHRMGPRVDPPHEFNMGEINWDKSVVGHFFDTNPPSQGMVQHLVDSNWVKRENISVYRTGEFYVFVCSHQADVEALIELHSTIIDGRVITFRRGSVSTILANIDFSKAWLWIRVVGLPLGLLDPEWALKCLNLIGYVELMEQNGDVLPSTPEFRAKVWLDLTKPLIPGCFVPVPGGQLVWVYFCYEGIYKFCKKCGLVGHYTCNCDYSAYHAFRLINDRMEGFESAGLSVIHGPMETPLYSNMIEGLSDRYRNRNVRVNLLLLGLDAELGNEDEDDEGEPEVGDDNQGSGSSSGDSSSDDNNDGGGGNLQNVVYQNGDVNYPHDHGQNDVNDGLNDMNLGEAQNGPLENDFIQVVSNNSTDDSNDSSGSGSYASAQDNSTEDEHEIDLGNGVPISEESDPLTPENYHHPVRFNVTRHTSVHSTFHGDPVQPYYSSHNQHFNPSFHMRAPSIHSDSSESNISEADLGGKFKEKQSEFRSNGEEGEPSHSVPQFSNSVQPVQVDSVAAAPLSSGAFVEGRPQVHRDNKFSPIPVHPIGLFGSAFVHSSGSGKINDELRDVEAYSGGKFGISDRAKTYIPSRGFSDSFLKRSSAVKPPSRLLLPGISNIGDSLNGLSNDPSTPSVHEFQSPRGENDLQAELLTFPVMVFTSQTATHHVCKKRKQPNTFVRSRSYEVMPKLGYSGCSWTHKRHRSFEDVRLLSTPVSDVMHQTPSVFLHQFANSSKNQFDVGKKRLQPSCVFSVSKKQKSHSSSSVTHDFVKDTKGSAAGPSQLPSGK